MIQGSILLVEDNEDDADLTILAFKRSNLANLVVVAEDGANAYVRKPVAFEEFLTTTARVGMFWLLANVNRPAAGRAP